MALPDGMSHPDHFELFGLAPRFAIDLDALERAYKDVQGRVHPDRFASGTAAERRVAMQWATRANEAYATLRNPQKRAQYLCELNGVDLGAIPIEELHAHSHPLLASWGRQGRDFVRISQTACWPRVAAARW